MSLYTITVDRLTLLSPDALTYALRIFQHELEAALARLTQDEAARTEEQVLDDLNQVLTLRKVFTLRLAELQEEAQRLAPQPAFNPEVDQLPQ